MCYISSESVYPKYFVIPWSLKVLYDFLTILLINYIFKSYVILSNLISWLQITALLNIIIVAITLTIELNPFQIPFYAAKRIRIVLGSSLLVMSISGIILLTNLEELIAYTKVNSLILYSIFSITSLALEAFLLQISTHYSLCNREESPILRV